MGRRYKIKRCPGHYVERDRRGRFKKWTGIHRSIRADTPRKAKHRPKKPGYGHLGDYKKRKRKRK